MAAIYFPSKEDYLRYDNNEIIWMDVDTALELAKDFNGIVHYKN